MTAQNASENALFYIMDRIDEINTEETSYKPIYHYTSIDALLRIIDNKRCVLRLSDTRYMNDPLEGRYYVQVIKRAAQELLYEGVITEEFCKMIDEVNIDQRKAFPYENRIEFDEYNTYMLSCSLESDSLPMWNYYSNPESGQCNIQLPKFSDLKRVVSEGLGKIKLYKVIYDKAEQHQIVKELLELIYKNKCYFSETQSKALLRSFFSSIQFKFKQPACSYEKEMRVIIEQRKKCDQRPSFRWAHGLLIPYITITLDYKIPIRMIKLGPLNKSELNVESIKQHMEKNGFGRTIIACSDIEMRF